MSSLILQLSAHLLSQSPTTTQRVDIPALRSDHSVVRLSGSEGDSSSFDIVVVFDPASDKAQEIIPIVKVGHCCHHNLSVIMY